MGMARGSLGKGFGSDGVLVIEVNNILPESRWYADCWEETIRRWVGSSGGSVGWVLSTGDVACNKKALVSICEVVDAPEDLVGLPVSTSSFPPPLNDSFVVSEDPEDLAWLACCAERASKKFEANGLSPSDIPAVCLPTWDEAPSSPLVADNNADAKT